MSKRSILYLGIITYALLLFGGILFYKERTVMLDSAYHLFSIIIKDGPAIQVHRFGAVLTQMFPLMAVKAGLSLETVAIVYSLSFLVFFACCFFITLLVIKNKEIALTILFFNVLMVTHTFYWPHPELPQGVVFCLVYFALLKKALDGQRISYWFLVTMPGFILTIVFFHPLLIFIFFFYLLYLLPGYKSKWWLLAVNAVLFIGIAVVKKYTLESVYEAGAIDGLKNIKYLFPDYFTIQSNKNLLRYLVNDYYFVIALLVGAVVFYIKSRQYYKLALLICFFFGFIFIVNISYAGGAEQFYLEAQYLLLVIFVALPFTIEILPQFRRPAVPMFICTILVFISLIRIWNTHKFYSARVDWYRNFLETTATSAHKKIILPQNKVPMEQIWMSWASSYEVWLLSTLEQKETRSLLIEEKPGEFNEATEAGKTFFTKWEKFAYKNMSKNYFNFSDTTTYVRY